MMLQQALGFFALCIDANSSVRLSLLAEIHQRSYDLWIHIEKYGDVMRHKTVWTDVSAI